ncbi:MAG: hypothetical protein CSB19_00520 [Clostridiales bacterium]|nr:MAG: hypothetical protein CSB19_00520 [Clostridiales bacterium]
MKLKTMPLGALGANSHILWNEQTNQAVVFDCGGEEHKIIEFLEQCELELKYIILTHGHSDHIMGVNALAKATGAKVIAHVEERDVLEDAAKNYSGMFGGDRLTVHADEYINGDEARSLIGYDFKFYHTPGHTRGGMCIEVEGQLFSGDTLFKGSIGRSDLYGGDMKVLMKSLQKLLKLSHRLNVHCGHGPSTTLRDEAKYNPFLQ